MQNEVSFGIQGTLENFTLSGSASNWLNDTNTNVTLANIKFDGGNEISIYPNPTKNAFNIESNFDGKMELYSPLGQLIFTEKITNGNSSFELNEAAAGVYFIKITSSENQVKTYKLIKQ